MLFVLEECNNVFGSCIKLSNLHLLQSIAMPLCFCTNATMPLNATKLEQNAILYISNLSKVESTIDTFTHYASSILFGNC